jgi:hypothetical protein
VDAAKAPGRAVEAALALWFAAVEALTNEQIQEEEKLSKESQAKFLAEQAARP